jgi:hypothetical protein
MLQIQGASRCHFVQACLGVMMIERRPWMLDDLRYPVADRELQEDGSLLVRHLKRSEFPEWAVGSKFNRWFLHRGFNTGWRCMITGVQCHLVNRNLLEGTPLKQVPWAVSQDHLVANHLRYWHDPQEHRSIDSMQNLTTVGWMINRNIGHVPLAIKLLHRKMFRDSGFGENSPTLDTFWAAKKQIIKTEDVLMFEGKYPWQPWTYSDTGQRKFADAFMAQMIDFHREFFEVPYRERQAWFNAFEWRW